MRTALIYVLSVTLLIAGGYHHAAGATSGKHHLSKFISNAEKLNSGTTKSQTVVSTTTVTDKAQTIVSIEDDEDDASFNRKLTPLAGYFFALVFAAFLFQTITPLKKRLPQATRLLYSSSQKYLLQGALLI